jgi:hypothetical protein
MVTAETLAFLCAMVKGATIADSLLYIPLASRAIGAVFSGKLALLSL